MANADKLNDGKLIKRSKRVSFLNVGTTAEPKFIRMQQSPCHRQCLPYYQR